MPKRTYPRIEPGTRFGRLTVVCYLHTDKHRKPVYQVLCDCGKEFYAAGGAMKTGNTNSCGCLHKERVKEMGQRPRVYNLKDGTQSLSLAGETFGKLLVLSCKASDERGVLWECRCECGKIATLPTCVLMKGTESCGCLRGNSTGCIEAAVKSSARKRKAILLVPDEDKPRVLRQDGYVTISGMYHHPNANKRGVIKEHRYVMSKHLGRPLRDFENVHHINGVRSDNRLDNLELWIKSQPPGQRVQDVVAYAKQIMELYPEYFSDSIH